MKKNLLAPRRYAFRLPVNLAARLEAWCEMHPQHTRAEWVRQWLETALTQAEAELPRERGPVVDHHPDTRQPIYLMTGPFAEFHRLVSKHRRQIGPTPDRDAPDAPVDPAADYLLGDE